MRRFFVISLILLCFLLESSGTRAQADPVNEIIIRVNALRAVYGRPAYQVDFALMFAAQTHADWGLDNLYFGHDGPDGSMPDERAKAAGYGNGENSFAIENVAFGTASLNTPELVVSMWQNDWGHLNAMISEDYEHIGVGFAEADGFSYYVMMVGWVGTKASSGDTQNQDSSGTNTSSEPFLISDPDESGAIYHEVQSGQAAWTIAAQYGIELAELLRLNNLNENSILHPGDVLMIQPPDQPTSTPTITPTRIFTTIPPTITPVPIQATEEKIESETLTNQIQEDEPNQPSVLPFVGLGLALFVGLISIYRLRK